MIIYDAENQILGRLSSTIAKQLLKGEKISVVNCGKAVISGSLKFTKEKYKQRIKRGEVQYGPFFPRTPDGIFRRSVRGMLPWDRPKGRKAYRNLKVFIGVPEKLKNKKMVKVKGAEASKLKCKAIMLRDLSISLGAKKRW